MSKSYRLLATQAYKIIYNEYIICYNEDYGGVSYERHTY